MSRRSVWMLLGVALIIIVPLVMGGEFGGADAEVAALIEAREGFAPWFTPIWEPPSGEVASLMFALQAALGALVIGYVVGRRHGRREGLRGKDGTTPPTV
ncbi:energy-coupling factor ABC transporter substrate-binding protein [Rhodobacter amnigenus]|nr:energy-coupling factor ABC transporter substrate-binding protein [Rhodobacter amnigenus]